MTLTAQLALGQIRHTLAGEPDSAIAGLMVLNQAGELLHSMHPWRWCERASYSLSLTAGQNYVALPSDFMELLALQTQAGIYGALTPVSLDALLKMRTTTVSVAGYSYWYAIGHALDTASVPQPRLEIYPTPSSSQSNAWTLSYRSGWTTLTTDTSIVQVPFWIESLYIAIVRAIARGYEEEDRGTIDERILQIQRGPLFDIATRRDIGVQAQHGQLERTAVSDVESDWPGSTQYLGLVAF